MHGKCVPSRRLGLVDSRFFGNGGFHGGKCHGKKRSESGLDDKIRFSEISLRPHLYTSLNKLSFTTPRL